MKRISLFLLGFIIVTLVLPLYQIPKVKAQADWVTPDAVHSKCGEETGHEAILAKDDDTTTYWKHIATCYHWIIFDMGESVTITKIRLYQGATTGLRFGTNVGVTVYVGDDPEDLGDAVWEGVLNDAGWLESGAFEKNGHYVKLVSKKNSDTQRMYEFDAYAEAAAEEEEYLEEFSETTSISASLYTWKALSEQYTETITITATNYGWKEKASFYTETTTTTTQQYKWNELKQYFTESITVTDQMLKQASLFRLFTESIVVTETSSFAKELVMLVSEFIESIDFDASLSTWKAKQFIIEETVSVAEAFYKWISLTESFVETIATSETQQFLIEKLFSITESIGVSTSLEALKEALVTFIEFTELIQFDADMILTFALIPPEIEPSTFGTLSFVIAIIALAIAVTTFTAKKRS